MGRTARIVVPGIPYHITHRGNRGQDIFRSPEDRDKYLEYLHTYSSKYELAMWAYCLMTNHVHMAAQPGTIASLARTLGDTQGRYAQWYNKRYGLRGHLWGNRFFSTPLDEDHVWAAVRYIELNPVRAGLVVNAEDYEWSSAQAHASGKFDPLLSPKRPFPGDVRNWSAFLRTDEHPERIEAVRRNTTAGRPCGSETFVKRLERKLGYKLFNPTRRRRSRS